MNTTKHDRKDVFRRTITICASGAGSLAVLALIGWATGRWELGALGRNLIPMAPSGAGLSVLFAGTLILRQLRPSWPFVRWFARLSMLATGGMSLLVIAQTLFGFESPLEGWLSPGNITIQGIAVGRMSIMTAVVFLIMVLAFAFESPPARKNRLWPQLASILSLCGFNISLVVSLSYAAGAPLLYGGRTVPMALPTALAFILLCAGLMLAAGPEAWPLSLFRSTYIRPSLEQPRWISGGLVAMFLVFIASIGLAGAFYLNSLVAEHRHTVRNELMAISDLKTSQIADWYRNKMNEAQGILRSPMIQRFLGQFLNDPAQTRLGQELQAWMEMQYELSRWSVALYDARTLRRLPIPPEMRVNEDLNQRYVQAAVNAEGIRTTDLHRHLYAGDDGRQGAFIDFWVPIRMSPGTEALGALMLRIDAAQFLFTLIQTWPIPSRTAETLLLRREGDQLVYLNELRHRPLAAMTPKGWEGSFEEKDYRGEPVYSILRGIPGTPWFLEVKIDREEIDAPLREHVRDDVIIALILILAVALSISVLGRRSQVISDRARQILADRIQHLTSMASDIIMINDENLMILEANESAQRAYGYSLEEFRRLSVRDICAPEVRTEIDRNARKISSQGRLGLESVHRRKDGSTFPVEGNISWVEKEGQKYYIGIFRDISERKQAEEKLREERKMLLTLINNIPDMVYFKDNEGRYVIANKSKIEALGAASIDEVVGKTVYDFFPPRLAEQFSEQEENIMRSGLVQKNFEQKEEKSSGEIEWRLETKAPLMDDQGRAIGLIIINRVITELKKAEENLNREHEILLTVINNVPDEIFFKDKAGRYVFVNKKKVETLGAETADQVVGKTAFDFFTADIAARFTAEDQASMRSGSVFRNNEYKTIRPDGKTEWEITTKVPVVDDKGGTLGILGISRDITDLKRAEEERRSLELQVQHSQKLESLGILAGGIAHDFNNLLMAILGNTEIALLRTPPDSPARQQMEEIRKAVHKAADLTTQMLAYSGKGNFMVRRLDLNDAIRGMAALLDAAISKKVRMEMHLAQDLPAIQADAAQIKQVAMNLITNASEAFGEDGIGKILVETGVRDCDQDFLRRSRIPEIPAPGRYVFLSVGDSGCGMTEETKASLFDPFFSTKFLGRGLGLAAVLGIVRGHKGAIMVESELGRGARFTVLFPVEAAS